MGVTYFKHRSRFEKSLNYSRLSIYTAIITVTPAILPVLQVELLQRNVTRCGGNIQKRKILVEKRIILKKEFEKKN